MPLVRKPARSPAVQAPEAGNVLGSLADPNPETRWSAARDAVGLEGAGAALAAAVRSEGDPRVRQAMFTSLTRMATPDVVEEVAQLLRSDNANLRTGALGALKIMVPEVPEMLPRLLNDPEADVRILSCELARSLASAEATLMLRGVLEKESDANVCAAAMDVLAEVGTLDALPSLEACARRFRDAPFVTFAIKVVIDRLTSRSTPTRA